MRTVIGALLVSGAAGLQLHKGIKLAAPALPVAALLPSAAVAAADNYEYGSAWLLRPLHEISSVAPDRPRSRRPTDAAACHRPTPVAPVRHRAEPIVTPRRAQVAAPDWVLPAGAVLAIATALLPLALKDGEEAAEEIFNQDESVRSLDPRKNRRL